MNLFFFRKKAHRELNFKKITRYAIIINTFQIVAALGIALYAALSGSFNLSGRVERILIYVTALVVSWGAVLDIRDAYSARNAARQRQMLEDAYRQLEALNGTLRAQRHDFMNHIQVIYSLTELEDRPAALEYMDRLYTSVRSAGRSLKTASPAVNALLAAKSAACQEKNVPFLTDIHSDWKDCPVPGWEMCRILGNLIDNALDAPAGRELKTIQVALWEDVKGFHFAVENNGAPVPEEIQDSLFQRGFSTKGPGRGMGLSIVLEIMEENGGEIRASSDETGTAFCGRLPKTPPENA